MMSDCNKCTHNEVCKYKEKFLDYVKKYNKDFVDSEVPFVESNLKCKHYQEPVVSIREPVELPYTIQPYTIQYDKTSDSSYPNCCKSCDFYNQRLSSIQPYIGDVPCQWCPKYPYKVTCETTTTTSNVK